MSYTSTLTSRQGTATTLEALAPERFNAKSLTCLTRNFRNKPNKNRNGRSAQIEAKRKGYAY